LGRRVRYEEDAVQREITERLEWLDRLEIGVLAGSDMEEAISVLTRGMRDDPSHVAAFGENPETRERELHTLLAATPASGDLSHALVARHEDGAIVGVCGMSAPGRRAPGRTDLRRRHDPEERCWHLGPLAVDAHVQGMGVEERLMCVSCARMDAARDDAYVETDRTENVRFYERFGFEVAGEQEVLGVSTYFMIRHTERRDE
jgi:ribosomal protein S18 acetylase RimI-like enzyme